MMDLRASVETFFRSYASAFNRSDMAAIEQHYALPAMLVHVKGQTVYEKLVQLRKKLQEVLRNYRKLRFVSCNFDIQEILPTGDELVCVILKWIVQRDAPLPELKFKTTYHLRKRRAHLSVQWGIVAVISFEEPALIESQTA